MMDRRPALRFAPSPNGALHLGHALSALTTERWARELGGRFLLRVEDIDPTRSRAEHVEGIFDDLAWLGLTWEKPVLHQSTRMTAYAGAAARLDQMGLLYTCYATRREIAEHHAATHGAIDPDGAPRVLRRKGLLSSDETARRAAAGAPFVRRLDMIAAIAAAADLCAGRPISYVELTTTQAGTPVDVVPLQWGDVVLQRKDVPTSYHLAVVVDDALQRITHVTRGQDLQQATHVHRLLQVLLGYPAPFYHHHLLITDADGRKLSKSRGDTSLRQLREAGITSQEIRRRLGF